MFKRIKKIWDGINNASQLAIQHRPSGESAVFNMNTVTQIMEHQHFDFVYDRYAMRALAAITRKRAEILKNSGVSTTYNFMIAHEMTQHKMGNNELLTREDFARELLAHCNGHLPGVSFLLERLTISSVGADRGINEFEQALPAAAQTLS